MKEHHKPKVIIYDITSAFDLHVGEDNHKYLGWLKESYERANVREIFAAVDKTEKVKMLSQMYRYNSKFHEIAADFIHTLHLVKENTSIPLRRGGKDKTYAFRIINKLIHIRNLQ